MDQKALNSGVRSLHEQIKSGRIKFAKGLPVFKSLAQIKYFPNGDVDPGSVDGVIRSLIKATVFLHQREELKQTSLYQIQELYFEFLEKNFMGPYELMIKTSSTPHMVAAFISEKKPDIVKDISDRASEIKELIKKFWDAMGPSVEAHLQDMRGLKSVYGGDIFPPYNQGILSRTGLYVDTIVLPDPVSRGLQFFGSMLSEQAVYYLIKHALSALSLKDVILAKLDPPIAVIAQDYVPLKDDITKILSSLSMDDVISHMNRAFGLDFDTQEKLDKFLAEITSIDELKRRLKSPERVVNDVEWKDLPLEEQYKKSEQLRKTMIGFGELGIGQKVKFDAFGRMMQANELIFKAGQLNGVPILDAPTSWQFLLWKYEYDKASSDKVYPNLDSTLIVNSLQSDRLSWLGNVPTDTLIRLRKEGALNELRKIISKDIEAIGLADDRKYQEVVAQIIANINQEFYKHMEELRKFSGKSKEFFGLEVAPLLITGGISIAAASTGNIPMSVISASLGVIGFPSVKDLWKDGKKLLKDREMINRSPVGILFDAHAKGRK